MGYKLAGFDVVGCNEIDPEVFKIYNLNHKPKFPFVMSIRDMLTQKTLPQELYNLDILDGSPPCTSFSTAGVRERDWGKEKRFSEGQALQRLDDLFFEFIALAQRLQPKIVVAENVAGMVKGKARGYIKEIVQAYDQAGYTTQLFRLNGANMGICQARDRVFFISVRKDLNLPKIDLQFNEKPIAFLQVEKWISGVADEYRKCTDNELQLWKKCKEGKSFASVHPKGNYFTYKKIHRNKPINTIHSGNPHFHYSKPRPLSTNEMLACSSFPIDYNWGNWIASKKHWAMGMSVPPFMIERIANEIYKQWLSVL
jgi:DNA (cytosine-5)-methyltransferase 1